MKKTFSQAQLYTETLAPSQSKQPNINSNTSSGNTCRNAQFAFLSATKDQDVNPNKVSNFLAKTTV